MLVHNCVCIPAALFVCMQQQCLFQKPSESPPGWVIVIFSGVNISAHLITSVLYSLPPVPVTNRRWGRRHGAEGSIDVRMLSHKRICTCVCVCIHAEGHMCKPAICSSVFITVNNICSEKMSMFPFGSLTWAWKLPVLSSLVEWSWINLNQIKTD